MSTYICAFASVFTNKLKKCFCLKNFPNRTTGRIDGISVLCSHIKILTFFENIQVDKGHFVTIDNHSSKIYEHVLVNACYAIRIVTDNSSQSALAYFYQLWKRESCLMVVSLIPEAITKSQVVKLRRKNTSESETNLASWKRGFQHGTGKQINV